MKRSAPGRFLAALFLVLAVASCSTVTLSPEQQDVRTNLYHSRLELLSDSGAWTLEGRLAVNDGQDGGSGHINWVHDNESSHMDFHGALGRGAWRLESDAEGAMLELADGEVFRAASVNELVQNQLGWQVPVDALVWWVRGLEAPGGYEQLELDENGLPVRLNQFGWDIEFDRYNTSETTVLPFKLRASRDNQIVKLAIRRWSLGQETDDRQ